MTKTVAYDGSSLSSVAPETITAIEAAHMGEAGMGTLVIDDDAGTFVTAGHKSLTISESTAPSGNRRVYTGRLGARRFRRGEIMVGAARQIEAELVDANVMLGDYIVTGTDGNRPAETVAARMAWLLASAYVEFGDYGFVVYPTADMDAVDYRGQSAGDVIADCSKMASFNYFLYYSEADDAIGLWFDDPISSSTYATTARISNVAADVDGSTVFAPFLDAELARDPSKIASGVYVPYAKGAEYRTSALTALTYTHRDMVATDANTKTAAKADALGDRLLVENATEDDTITVTVQLPAAHVNDFRAGQLMQAKFSHFGPEGYDEYSYFRIVKRTLRQPQNTDFQWDVILELTPAAPLFPTYAYAEIVYPQADSATGPVLLNWANTGDNPRSPRPAHPLQGLMAYSNAGVDPSTPSDETGIEMLGSGDIDVHCQAGFEFGWNSGTHDVTLNVYIGATLVGSATKVDTGSGIHVVAGYLTVDLTGVTVVTNDILTAELSWSGSAAAWAIPIAGTDGGTYMSATGLLA